MIDQALKVAVTHTRWVELGFLLRERMNLVNGPNSGSGWSIPTL